VSPVGLHALSCADTRRGGTSDFPKGRGESPIPGKTRSGVVIGEDTLTSLRRVLGDDHPETLQSVHSLAAVRASLGEHDWAR